MKPISIAGSIPFFFQAGYRRQVRAQEPWVWRALRPIPTSFQRSRALANFYLGLNNSNLSTRSLLQKTRRW